MSFNNSDKKETENNNPINIEENGEYKDRIAITDDNIKNSFNKYCNEDKLNKNDLANCLNMLGLDEDTQNKILECSNNINDEQISQEIYQELIKAVTDVGDVESIEKIQEYLRLLNEYRIKCENEGNFPEANRALAKFEELRIREQQKVEDNIKHNQMEEIKYLEDLHKKQFLDFSEAWDQQMKDYEDTAYKSLETLKAKHKKEYEDKSSKIREETRKKLKFSKEVIELRHKLEQLAKQKRYEEAEKLRKTLEKMEEFDRKKLQQEFENAVERKEATVKQKQQLELQAMLKRIQRDRNEQIKHRQTESHKLLKRNNNIKHDLLQRQRLEQQKNIEENRLKMGMCARDGMNLTS